MRKKIIIFLVFWLFIVNIFSIKAFYNNYLWKQNYENNKLAESIEYFKKANNIYWVYNEANSLYKQKKYVDSIKELKSILTDEKTNLNFRINHNIWNIFYRLWEWENNEEKKIKNWEESVQNYSNALDIHYDEETKKNLEFVLNKIKLEKKKQEENEKQEENKDKEQESSDKNNTKDNEDKKTWSNNSDEKNKSNQTSDTNKKDAQNTESKSWDSKQESDENKEWTDSDKSTGENNKSTKNDEAKSWNSKQESTNKDWTDNDKSSNKKTWTNQASEEPKNNDISQEQEEILKQYEQELKRQQEENSNNFNKVYSEQSYDPFDNFFNDPFFDNSLLDNWEDIKDW